MRDLADDPLKIAIVGLGRWGNTIAGALRGTPELKLTACFSRSPDARAAFARTHGCVAAQTYAELLARTDVEAVIVTVPNDRHAEVVIAAARAGKHVCVDKPIATTIADARAMIAACAQAGVTLAVGASARFLRGHRVVKRLVDDGVLGNPAMVEASISNERGLYYGADNWHYYAAACPGGPLLQTAIHQIDNLYHLFGPVRRVSAAFRKIVTRSELPDVCVLWLEFESGLLGTLGTSFISPGDANRNNACFIHAYGDRANIFHTRWNGTRIFRQGGGDYEPVAYDEFAGFDYLGEELRDFAAAVVTGRAPEVTGEAGLHVLAVVLAAVRSGALQRPVGLAEPLQ
jgi:predicted dehydrogenase